MGQMAIVSAVMGSQVEISYRGPTGQIKTRRKQQALLIVLDYGVELFVNAQGWPILRMSHQHSDTDDDDGLGVVSADNES